MIINFLHEKIRRDMVKHYAETGDDWALGVLADIPGWIARTGAPEYLGGAAYREKQRRTLAIIDEMRARIRKMDPENVPNFSSENFSSFLKALKDDVCSTLETER